MVKFLADENISPLTTNHVKNLGYDIIRVENAGLVGADDFKILTYAESKQRMIITLDLDFGDMYYYSQTINIGILILRISP